MKRAVIADGRRLEYTLIQSGRKNVMFQALPRAGLRVYAPKYLGLRAVDELVRQRADELAGLLDAVERRLEADRMAHPVAAGSPILYEGAPHTLRLSRGGRTNLRIEDGELRLTLPRPEDEEAVRAALRSALSGLALTRIRERLAEYAPRVGKPFGRVAIRDQKSRWGSCSAKGNLNFNWKLIMAPPQVLDYVVIHELCHLHEFNHSPRFWALVERQMPEYGVWKRWLKDHAQDLMI